MKDITLFWFLERKYNLNRELASRFIMALDRRLMDHATGSGIISPDEYELWAQFVSIHHIATVIVVRDAVTAALQEVMPGAMRRDWDVWIRETTPFIEAIEGIR